MLNELRKSKKIFQDKKEHLEEKRDLAETGKEDFFIEFEITLLSELHQFLSVLEENIEKMSNIN